MSPADANVRRFIAFRVLFNARFYYPVYAVLFLDYGLSLDNLNVMNFIWAITIVALEVPSGALADQLGRKRLVVFATLCMIAEMALLAFVPLGSATLLFAAVALNRILSGAAEAAASGADEALVFDSLAAEGRASEWPSVLARLGRWQSAGFLVSGLLGGLCYDASALSQLAGSVGVHWMPDPKLTMRFPAYLTFLSAFVALAIALRLTESPRQTPAEPVSAASTLRLMRGVAGWMWALPLAVFLVAAGLLHDSIIRLVLTFGAEYYRAVHVPVAAFGLLSMAFGIFGFFVPPLGRWLIQHGSVRTNFALLSLLTVVGLIGLQLLIPWWGVLFGLLLGATMSLLNVFLSHYLNALAEPATRATLLSFRGLAFNLGYGFVSLGFAALLKAQPGDPKAAFAGALTWLPGYFVLTLVPLALFAWRTCCLDLPAAQPTGAAKPSSD